MFQTDFLILNMVIFETYYIYVPNLTWDIRTQLHLERWSVPNSRFDLGSPKLKFRFGISQVGFTTVSYTNKCYSSPMKNGLLFITYWFFLLGTISAILARWWRFSWLWWHWRVSGNKVNFFIFLFYLFFIYYLLIPFF